LLLCVCAILPAKAIPEMTYTVLGETLNPAHSLSYVIKCICVCDDSVICFVQLLWLCSAYMY